MGSSSSLQVYSAAQSELPTPTLLSLYGIRRPLLPCLVLFLMVNVQFS